MGTNCIGTKYDHDIKIIVYCECGKNNISYPKCSRSERNIQEHYMLSRFSGNPLYSKFYSVQSHLIINNPLQGI